MRFVLTSLALPAFALGLTAAPVPKEKAKVQDEDAIQGTWKVETFDMGGGPGGPAPGEIAKLKLTFKDGKLTVDNGDGRSKEEIVYKLDPTAKPKAIDLSEDGKVMALAIYELDGDSLKLCMAEGGGMLARPEEFKSDGKRVAVITLKRMKDVKKDK